MKDELKSQGCNFACIVVRGRSNKFFLYLFKYSLATKCYTLYLLWVSCRIMNKFWSTTSFTLQKVDLLTDLPYKKHFCKLAVNKWDIFFKMLKKLQANT